MSEEAPGDRFLPLLDPDNSGALLRSLDGAVHALALKMREATDGDECTTVNGQMTIKLAFSLRDDDEISVGVSFSEPTVTRKLPFSDGAHGRYCIDAQGNLVLTGSDDEGQGRLDFKD